MRRRRSRMPRPRQVIQSFKKVINQAPASVAAGSNVYQIAQGVDSVAAGQTSAVDVNVPTGSIIKNITIQFSLANLVSIATFAHVAIVHLRSGQSAPAANVVGGDPRRNQVHYQNLYSIGKDQNRDIKINFKIPAKFQRVREDDQWVFVITTNQITTQVSQYIYKFYR